MGTRIRGGGGVTGVDVEHTKALEQVATDGGWAIWRDLDAGFYVVGEESGVIPEGADHVDGEYNPVAHVYVATDAAFIVHARTAVPALVAAVERVQALHTPYSPDAFSRCRECAEIMPCPTIRALEIK